jgi:cyclopropane fatty-acyl-phospholipid synthase-like methyltransferase
MKLSKRLAEIVEALPVKTGSRVLEIGCGPGAAARALCKKVGKGHVLGIDRSAKAISLAESSCREEISKGRLSFRKVSIEDFKLEKGEKKFDLIFAIRVGALDGRHPEAGKLALDVIRSVLAPGGRVFIDGGKPLKELKIKRSKA